MKTTIAAAVLSVLVAAGLLAAALPAAGGVALAQTATDHSGHGMAPPAAGDDGPSTQAYRAANEKMHRGMDIIYSGDSDVDFARGMIAHHQGAIDMAKVVLEHGNDPEIRKLAEAVITAQEAEIAWLQDWLARRGQ